MPTVEDVARHVAGITSSEQDLLLISTWINQRWKELANTNTLRMLRRTGELTTQPTHEDGTIDVTQGSRAVTGTATNWTPDLAGLYLRQKTNWHRIALVNSPTSLTLESAFAEPTTTGSGYFIVRRAYRLAPNIRKLLPVVAHMRLRRTVQVVSRESLDMSIPSRFSINQVPQYICEVEPDVDGTKQVEIYPFPRQPELLHYIYWLEPFDLDMRDQMPSFIDIEAFREGVMIDLMRHRMFTLMHEGKARESELMRNEYQATLSRWNNTYKTRVLSQDDALDDLEFLLTRTSRRPMWGGADNRIIDDAYAHVWFGTKV